MKLQNIPPVKLTTDHCLRKTAEMLGFADGIVKKEKRIGYDNQLQAIYDSGYKLGRNFK